MLASAALGPFLQGGVLSCARVITIAGLGCLQGCSLQDFHYLEQGSETRSGGGVPSTSHVGGSHAGGGASAAQGTTTGGDSATGGAPVAAGGAASGGAPSGGAASGGAASGGAAYGGATSSAPPLFNCDTTTDAGDSNPVTPVQVSDTDYSLTMPACDLVMDINPQVGARVTNLTLDGANIVAPCTCASGDSANNSAGATFWTSPQRGWPTYWPPVAAVDSNPYTPTISGAHLIATGGVDVDLGAMVTKDFSADDGTCWITLVYTITATKDISVAPWEVTRVPHGGIAFFPLGQSDRLLPGPLLSYVTTDTTTDPNVVWFDDTAKTASNSGGSKLVADGTRGWLAYAMNGNLYIKTFPDIMPAASAPSEGDVEIYADPASGILQLEAQGAYTTLAQGESLAWRVQWRVVSIPNNVRVAPGDASLLEFAQQQVCIQAR